MAEARKCDICDQFYNLEYDHNFAIKIIKEYCDRTVKNNEYYDICPSCMKNVIFQFIPFSPMLKEEFEDDE